MKGVKLLILISFFFFALWASCVFCRSAFSGAVASTDQRPEAWGSDHVGQPMPEFVSGDECLFCHRSDIGPNWPRDRHNRTLREPEPGSAAFADLKKTHPEVAGLVKYVLGGEQRLRFLKASPEYGKLELLSTEWEPPHAGRPAHLIEAGRPQWDGKKFGDSCAGCHASAVDVKTHAFSAASLDCFTCHGNVDVKHSKDPKLVFLAKKRNDSARVVTSICPVSPARRQESKQRVAVRRQFRGGGQSLSRLRIRFLAGASKGAEPRGPARRRERARRGPSRERGGYLPLLPQRTQAIEQEAPPGGRKRLLP